MKKDTQTPQPTYKVEILTASKAGLQAFMEKVVQAKNGRTSRGAITRDRGMRYPMAANGGKQATLAQVVGPLNRDVIPGRVNAYRDAMFRGEWWFTPDPIVVTDEGDIINGQHRLLAAVEALPGEDDKDPITPPQFVVVWGVDKRAAILMDEARRSSADRRDIALRFAASTRKGSGYSI